VRTWNANARFVARNCRSPRGPGRKEVRPHEAFAECLVGENSCRPQYGYFRDALITDKRWRTSKGLRIGHPSRYVLRYYPAARPSSSRPLWWSLVLRNVPYFDRPYAALSAKVVDGLVVAFEVYYQAGGE
jgi:hypothetical protein